MSYSSRVYRQRNAHTHEEGKKEGFFKKNADAESPSKKSGFFQPKLKINKPGDAYEKEADSVANTVVNSPGSKNKSVQRKKINSIQRLSTSAEDEKQATNDARMAKDKEIQEKSMQMGGGMDKEKKKGIQKKDEPKKEEDERKKSMPVQKKPEGNSFDGQTDIPSRISQSAGKGRPLPGKTLMEVNAQFGMDFSRVRIHDDAESATMCMELRAQAFTHGCDIYFNAGKFNPDNTEGRLLLVHELTHVIQQKGVVKSNEEQANEREKEK